ncbi:hypothetical protein BH11ARM2_BH11ARM2_30580 [soil metagenome]
MKGRIGVFVFIALGLLLAAVGGQYLSRLDDRAEPKADSVRPSGAAAFAELLRHEGYAVRIDQSPSPRIRAGEVAVVFEQGGEIPGALKAHNALLESVRAGRGMVTLPMPASFDAAVRRAEASPFKVWRRTDDAEFTMASDPDDEPRLSLPNQVLYYDDDRYLVSMARRGKGIVVGFADGSVATNRLLDKGDNAKILLDAIRIAGGKTQIVFPEATFSGETPGLLATLGPWAQALFYQTLFLIAVAVATLGRRYGLEDVPTKAIRSSRDIANGIADTLQRGRMAGVALGILMEDRERMKGEKPSSEMRRLLSHPDVTEKEALDAARRLLSGACQSSIDKR